MHETADELAGLQRLLDASHAGAGEHLRSIIEADRRLTARDLVALLTGMRVLSLATTTAGGQPRISAVDGHFVHGTWSFSTSLTAVKAGHMLARPDVSVAHVDGEQLAVFSHGRVERMRPQDPDWDETIAHWTAHYGSSPLTWTERPDQMFMARYRPHWMVGYAWRRSELLAGRGLPQD